MNRIVAHFFSIIGHPVFVLTYVLLLMLSISPYAFAVGNMFEQRGVLLLFAVFVSTVLLPVVGIGMMKSLGMVQTWQLSDKQERIGPFILSGVFYLWLFKNLLSGAQTPILYTAFVLGATISLFVCFFLNIFTKISVHAAGMGGFVSMLILLPFSWNEATEMVPFMGVYLSWPVVIALAVLLAGAVGTARLALRAHTPTELYRGYVVGAAAVFFFGGIVVVSNTLTLFPMINFAIIGPGKIARKFAEDLRLVPGAQLFAVASNTLARAQEFAQQFNCPHAFGSYEQMLDFPGIDVVYIATPHVFHYEHTLLCLRKGHHVLCEKPFSMHPDQTREMIALAREKNLFLMEALWTLFHPAYNKALELARSGAIGQVHSAKADFSFFSPYNAQSRLFSPQLGGGALLDIGVYPLLFFQDLFGVPRPDDIQAAATLTRDGVDETCVFTIRYSDRQLALGHCSIAANTPVEATIYGSEGEIHLNSRFHHPTQLTIRHYLNQVTETIDMPYDGWGYQFEAAHVVQCLERGQTESDRIPHAFTQGLTDTVQVILDKIGVQYE